MFDGFITEEHAQGACLAVKRVLLRFNLMIRHRFPHHYIVHAGVGLVLVLVLVFI